jgi:CheY-like chemotaxis protein
MPLLSACTSDFGTYTSMPAPLGQGVRVLVVEDDPVQALVLMLFLERLGVVATHVTDGAHAIDAVRSQRYGIVLMDYLMPKTNGVQATRAIRRWEREVGRMRVPIVAVTASAMTQECQAYRDAGMDDVLVKPFSARDLRDVLMRYLTVEEPRRAST